ncbi:ABC transporter permease [Xanthocytophaga agilis]|uniref:ABC transporter permease n=1 Tax=Xanthocytophaga agilis TaxID=3048010 RepID=A0AAE3R9T0_9BACT|nr:ABC transporter permease [Xanthocytophaga agilis]MDJ1504162.1 ABC transporter permease [Xanthocytophaga agilis]
MIKHLFKLIWNQKRKSFLLITEIFFSFMVLFAVLSLMVKYIQNYSKPMGFEYENVWVVNLDNLTEIETDSLGTPFHQAREFITSFPEVEAVSFASQNLPFAASTHNSSVKYGNISSMAHIYTVEDTYPKTMNLQMSKGRWFDKTDQGTKYQPIVITEQLSQNLFGNENPIGKIIKADTTHKVVGVVASYKDKGDFTDPVAGIFFPISAGKDYKSNILVKVKPGTGAIFEAKLFKGLGGLLRGWNVEIEHLTDKKANQNKVVFIPMTVLLIVCTFLIFNVSLGLFGILWQNINQRKGEIGLRRAIGATEKDISKQFIGEVMVIATFALIIGLFFAVQFPLLHVFDLAADIYLIAMLISVIVIYLLVMVCAFNPSRQAASIQPAMALHEE